MKPVKPIEKDAKEKAAEFDPVAYQNRPKSVTSLKMTLPAESVISEELKVCSMNGHDESREMLYNSAQPLKCSECDDGFDAKAGYCFCK